MNIQELVFEQRKFYQTHQTIDVNFRISYLKKLRDAIYAHESEIHSALKKDLGKSEVESFMCEVGMTLSELTYQLKHIKKWSKPHRHTTDLVHFHAKSFTDAISAISKDIL